MAFTFPAMVAEDPATNAVVKNVSFQVYAVTDTGFTTPLAITDTFNNPLAGGILNSGTKGIFPQFQQATNSTVVITDATHVYAWTINCVQQDSAISSFINTPGSATATALSATYAPIASPTFTGTVGGVTKAMVGLGSVDNTADTAKPVSTAQATAIALKLDASQKGAASGVASLDSGTKVPAAQIPDLSGTYAPLTVSGNGVVRKNELFIRAEDYSTFQAALDAGAAAKKDVVFSTNWTLTSGLTWQANIHSIRGFGDARLDFTGMSSGTALTVIGLGTMDYTVWEFMSEIHTASGFQMIGPSADATTVDGILITSDTSKVSHINLDHLYVKGFRDGVILGNNTWCVTFNEVVISGAKRRGLSIIATTNSGENYSLHGCTVMNVTNSGSTAVGIYTDVSSQFLGVNLFGVSLDYCDYLFDHNAGTLSFHGCHWENNTSVAMGLLSYTAGNARTSLVMNGCVVDPSDTRPGRSHLIEVKSTSGGAVSVSGVGNTFRLYDRVTHVLKNLSASTPLVRWLGAGIDNSVSTSVGAYGHYTSQIISGDMEGSISFIGTFDDTGGWYRQGTVVYSFDNTVYKSGTQSLKMLGDGTVAATGAGQTFRVQPKTILSVSFYLKSSLTAGTTAARLTWKKADKTTVGSTVFITTVSAAQDWTPYSAQYMVPVGAEYVGLTFVNTNLNGATWVDEVIATVL